MHQHIEFTHMVVRYEEHDYLPIVVAYATSLEEAQALLRAFIGLASRFAPTALYAVRGVGEIALYRKAY